MFKKNPPSYLDSYLAVVERDLDDEQNLIDVVNSMTQTTENTNIITDLQIRQAAINMRRRAIESLRTPIAPRS